MMSPSPLRLRRPSSWLKKQSKTLDVLRQVSTNLFKCPRFKAKVLEGGRFPSTDLIVNPTRGLQVPLSPSSGSSILDDVHERDIIAASGNVPGNYADEPSSPTHAARLNQLAAEDRINPYTALPLDPKKPHQDTKLSTGQTVAAGFGGAVGGIAGLEAYHSHEKSTNPQQLEALAAQESSKIAAPDTNERQAALEASVISAPDNLSPTGGHSLGLLAGQTDAAPPRPAVDSTHQSNYSISQLHVPGEYPKAAKDGR
jgi:hypothetical protein